MKVRLTALIVLLAIILSACSFSLADDITPPPDYKTPTPAPTLGPIFPANPPDLTAGAALYAEKCAPCHGVTGLGDGPMAPQLPKPAPAFGKPEVARAGVPANWFTTVTQGKIDALMPGFISLSEQQRWDVVAYALSLGLPADEIAQGQTIYAANCAQCHGADGKLVAKADLTNQAMLAKLSQDDLVKFSSQGVGDMPGLGAQLNEAELLAVAAYVRTLTFAPATSTAAAATTVPSAEATPAAETTAAPAESTGTIAGTITNGSGGTIPTGLTALLHIFEHDVTTQQFTEVDVIEIPVSAEGAYAFKDVAMPATRAFYVSVDYMGTTYESEAAIPSQDGQTAYDLPISIYDTTTDTSALKITQAHILLDYSKESTIQVIEFYVISNGGNKAIVAATEGGAVLNISLPKGYTNLQFEDGQIGDRYIQTAAGFADTLAVPPTPPTDPADPSASQGTYSLVFAFDLPTSKASGLNGLLGKSKFQFTQVLPLDAEAISILVPEGVKAEGQNFTDGGLQDMGSGQKYQLYTAGGHKAGESLSITTSGQPTQAVVATPTGSDSTRNIIIGVGVFGVVLILIGVWLYWRDRRTAQDEDEADEEDESPEDEKEASAEDTDEVMDAIIALDDQFKSGNITEEAYKQRRAELKARLKGKL